MKRDLELHIGDNGMIYAIFNSNGRRVKRLITPAEHKQAAEIIGDNEKEDAFCSRIV